jgi:hypothetical protein
VRQLAADLCPGKARHCADLVLFLADSWRKRRTPAKSATFSGVSSTRSSSFKYLAKRLARHLGDLALQGANPRLAGV